MTLTEVFSEHLIVSFVTRAFRSINIVFMVN